jgi:hexosaminidase
MTSERIFPKPVSQTLREGVFTITESTHVIAQDDALKAASLLCDFINPATGYHLTPKSDYQVTGAILLNIIPALSRLGSEGYLLSIKPQQVRVDAFQPAGLLHAVQTIRQLLPAEIYSLQSVAGKDWVLPCMEVEDFPRFSWRGGMLDSCRHFMPLSFIYRFLDLLAMQKMNSFHWHLTDDQGWRLEIKKYPRLTEVGSWREQTMVGHYQREIEKNQYDGIRHGGFYTQEQVRQVVAYAVRLGINVVPEIEMPGHSQAAIAAYPELGNTNEEIGVSTGWGIHLHVFNVEESTIRFLQDVLDEVVSLFPSPFIHIGGDEEPKQEWKASPRAQERLRELGLHDEDELQSYFIRRMDNFLNERGRRLIGWDEILEGGLAPNATVMSWRGEAGGIAAVKAGHDVVMAPNTYTYFDYYQSPDHDQEPLSIGSLLPLEKVYSYEPIPTEIDPENAHHILGTQGQLWSEYIPTPERMEYMAFPRLCALAEVAWTPAGEKDFSAFKNRLACHLTRLDQLKVNYRKLD